jgi:tRNA (mo5U34)-methyltransferase
MGVLYHRRSPFEHLFSLKSFLREGGELILETLVIEGKKGEVLVPEGRYAKMRNVWFIPSPLTLESWLKRTGFKNIHLINVTKTTLEEQRKTDWMPWESLQDFLSPSDENKTIEGYPAPRRAIFICEK